jgi:hypothetical protein
LFDQADPDEVNPLLICVEKEFKTLQLSFDSERKQWLDVVKSCLPSSEEQFK